MDQALAGLTFGDGDEVFVEARDGAEATLVIRVRSLRLATQLRDRPELSRRPAIEVDPAQPLDHVELVRRIRWSPRSS